MTRRSLFTIQVIILGVLYVSQIFSVNADVGVASSSQRYHAMESFKPRHDFVQIHDQPIENPHTTMHEVIIAITKLNIPSLQEMIIERATPGSPLYQQWFSYDEITEIVRNDEGFDSVMTWLNSAGVESGLLRVKEISNRRDYIHVEGSISQWEELLQTKFHVFHDNSYVTHIQQLQKTVSDVESLKPLVYHRCLSYSIPIELKDHIEAIFNTVQAPLAYHPSVHVLLESNDIDDEDPNQSLSLRRAIAEPITGEISYNNTIPAPLPPITSHSNRRKIYKTTVPYLQQFYQIDSKLRGDPQFNQSVFLTSTEYFSQSDLLEFQTQYSLTLQQAISIGGRSLGFTPCPPVPTATKSCYEGNLDIQYIMGIAQETSSIFWYVPRRSGVDAFATWLVRMANSKDPPQSNSMSWGAIEQVSNDKR